MKRRIVLVTAVLIALFLGAAGVFRSQDVPEPPEPPEPAVAPVPPASVLFDGGGARLGVRLRDVSPERARELKLPAETGAIITEVEENSPASKAGLAKNDVVLEFDGERVRSVSQLRRLVRETPVGRTVTLKVSRAGQTRTLSVKLEAVREHYELLGPEVYIPHIEMPEFNFRLFTHGPSLGISGDELTPQLAEYFGVKQGKGVLVREVTVGSPAEKAGLKAGDVVVQVDGKSVGSVSELRSALASGSGEEKRQVNLTIVRDRHEQTLGVELERGTPGERRRVAEYEAFGIDPAELSSLQAEFQSDAATMQLEAQKWQKEMQAQQQRMQGEWRRQMEEARRQLQDAFKLEKQVRALPRKSEVI